MQGALRVDEALRRPLDLCPICLRKLQHLLGFRLVDRYKVRGRGRGGNAVSGRGRGGTAVNGRGRGGTEESGRGRGGNAVNGRGRGGNEESGRGRGGNEVSGQGAVWTPALSLRGLSGSG